jgi:hypothetical protein
MKPEKKDKNPNKLEGFEVKINELGEIISSKNMDQVNKFLDKNLIDKKTGKGSKKNK